MRMRIMKLQDGYVIKSGDNLSVIAKQNGASLLDILKLNPLIKNPNLIKPGDNLKLPVIKPKALVTRPSNYTIKSGDNLSTIARQYGTTLNDVLRDNPHIKDANLIKPGDNIKLPLVGPLVRSFSEIESIEEQLNKSKSNTDLIHHHYVRNGINNNYIIDDKKNGHLSIYNKGKLVKRYPAIHGKNKASDDLTITKTNERGKLINMAGNLSTPAGFYQSKYSDSKYHGAPSYIRYSPWMVEKGYKDGIPSSIHARTIKEGANTNGCTGMGCEDLKDMDKVVGRKDYVDTYVLPVEKDNKFFIRNGVVLFNSNDTSLTPAYNSIVKTPIERFEYQVPEGITKLQQSVIKRYTDSLITNKESLLDDLGINNDSYIRLSKLAYGILGTESTFGKRNAPGGNFLRAINKVRAELTGSEASSPDIYSKFETYRRNGDWDSVGLTQMKFAVATKNPKAKALFEKYGITKDDLVHDPAKAAIATLIHLSTLYNETNRDIDKTISRWNDGEYYAPKVKKYSSGIEAYLMYRRGGLIKR